jgi:D-alanine-D-alanine ligase
VVVVDGALSRPGAPPDAADALRVAASVAEALGGAEIYGLSPPLGPALKTLAARFEAAVNLVEGLGLDSRLEPLAARAMRGAGLKLTGSGPEALRLCLHKESAKRALLAAGVPTPRAAILRRPPARLPLALPCIVKPCREDGSVGIDRGAVVDSLEALRARVGYVTGALSQPALAEEYIDGRELNLSVLEGDAGPALLPPAEIDFGGLPPGAPRIVAYDAKWTPGSAYWDSTARVFPELAPPLYAAVRRAALTAFSALGLSGYGRVDIRLDARGRPFVIDVNPNCDLAPDAGLAAAAERAGMSYPALIAAIVRRAR